MARLKEADIRRIIRDEYEREKAIQAVSDEAVKVSARMHEVIPPPTFVDPWTRVRVIDGTDPGCALYTQKVIDTYWKVVEEELNE